MMYGGGGSGTSVGQMSDAMVNAVRAQVFSRPLMSLDPHPSQVAAGRSGQLGAFGGHPQGPTGASVLQSGQNQPKTGTAASARPQSQPAAQNASTGSNPAGNGPPQGLMMLLPLLGFVLAHILTGGGGMQGTGGFGDATPQGTGKV